MSAHRREVALATLVLILAATACVDARPEDPLGNTQFIASNALASQDYAPEGPASKLGAAGTSPIASPTAPSSAAGGGSVVPPTAASTPTSTPMGGAPAPARAGAGATAGTSGAGRAGAPAAAGGAAPGATAGGPATTGPAQPATGGMLTIDFKSVSLGGSYAPRNVGAVWIETASGMFVKTLERWAGIRVNHLSRWSMASGGWGGRFGGATNPADMMDAVSRATLRAHEMHHVMWNMKDTKGQIIPDGMYNVVIEVADDSRRASTNASVAFMKGPAPQMVTAPDKAPWSGFSLNYQP